MEGTSLHRPMLYVEQHLLHENNLGDVLRADTGLYWDSPTLSTAEHAMSNETILRTGARVAGGARARGQGGSPGM